MAPDISPYSARVDVRASGKRRAVYIARTNCPDGGVIQRILVRPLIEVRAIDYTPIGSADRVN